MRMWCTTRHSATKCFVRLRCRALFCFLLVIAATTTTTTEAAHSPSFVPTCARKRRRSQQRRRQGIKKKATTTLTALEVQHHDLSSPTGTRDESLVTTSSSRPQPQPTSRRRQLLLLGGALTAATTAATPAATATADDLVSLCQDGRLAPEEAVPGAYQQPCMSIPVRRIPIHFKEGTTTYVDIEQGSVGAGSTGMAVWNSALLLTRLLSAVDDWQDKTVVELGCGTGLASLATAVLGATRVLATDGNADVVDLVSRNIRRNNLQETVSAKQFQWGLFEAMDYFGLADVVIGADLTYNAGSWPLLAETMETILKPQTGMVIYLSVGHSGFSVDAEVDGFLAVAKQRHGLKNLHPGDKQWPFSAPTNEILDGSLSVAEQNVLQTTGGLRVEVLMNQ